MFHARPLQNLDTNSQPIRTLRQLQGVLYARPGGRGEEAMLTWRPFQSLYGTSDWNLPLPAGDRVEAIAAGKSFLAVATSQHHLRILTTSGMPPVWGPYHLSLRFLVAAAIMCTWPSLM